MYVNSVKLRFAIAQLMLIQLNNLEKKLIIIIIIYLKIRIDTIANADEFDRIINKLDVLSRSRPEDKYALVVGLIERGNVVAVTGDGSYLI